MNKLALVPYYGGKSGNMLYRMLMLMPYDGIETWVEPFMGSAGITLNHHRCKNEIINDKDSNMVNLLQVIQRESDLKEFLKELKPIIASKDVYRKAETEVNSENRITKAVSEYILLKLSFNATRSGYSNKLEGCSLFEKEEWNIWRVHKRLQGIKILCSDALSVINNYKRDSKTFIVADPPYQSILRNPSATNVYRHELTRNEQELFLDSIVDSEARVMINGYKSSKNDLYDRKLLPYGWRCYKLGEFAKSSSNQGNTKPIGEEFIWVNYELPEFANYVIDIEECNSLEI